VGIILGIALLVITVKLSRQFRMREEHALPWLMGGVVLVLVCLFVPLLKLLSWAMGSATPSTTLFAGSILFLLVQSFLYAGAVSRQKKQIQELGIALALLKVQHAPDAPSQKLHEASSKTASTDEGRAEQAGRQ
jgi:hypothetical protein